MYHKGFYVIWTENQYYIGMTMSQVKRKLKTLTGLLVSDKQKSTLKWVCSSAPLSLIKISDQTCVRLLSGVKQRVRGIPPFLWETSYLGACLFSKQIPQPYRNGTRSHSQPKRGVSFWQMTAPTASWPLCCITIGPRVYHRSITRKVLGEAALQAQRQAHVGGEVLQEVRLPASLICHLLHTHTPCD